MSTVPARTRNATYSLCSSYKGFCPHRILAYARRPRIASHNQSVKAEAIGTKLMTYATSLAVLSTRRRRQDYYYTAEALQSLPVTYQVTTIVALKPHGTRKPSTPDGLSTSLNPGASEKHGPVAADERS
jgi:hypothetical protein